jgi:hypothetical protein
MALARHVRFSVVGAAEGVVGAADGGLIGIALGFVPPLLTVVVD